MNRADAIAALEGRTPGAQRAVLNALPPEFHPPNVKVGLYTIGFECELANHPASLIPALRDAGLTNADHLHAYHCRCAVTCGSPIVDIHPQTDGTCAGELITRVLQWLTPETASVFERLGHVLATTGTNPIGDQGMNGFHVHVGKPHDWTMKDHLALVHIFAAYQRDIAVLAQQWRTKIRRYNHPIWSQTLKSETDNARANYSGLFKGCWLADRGHTYEFRMWNGVQSAWRMRMNVGLSVAFLRAARVNLGYRCSDTVTAQATELSQELHPSHRQMEIPVAKRGAGSFLDVVGPHIDDVVLADVLRQLDDRSKVDA